MQLPRGVIVSAEWWDHEFIYTLLSCRCERSVVELVKQIIPYPFWNTHSGLGDIILSVMKGVKRTILHIISLFPSEFWHISFACIKGLVHPKMKISPCFTPTRGILSLCEFLLSVTLTFCCVCTCLLWILRYLDSVDPSHIWCGIQKGSNWRFTHCHKFINNNKYTVIQCWCC